MTNRVYASLALLTLTAGLTGCDTSRPTPTAPTAPAAPSPVLQPPPSPSASFLVDVTLSGTVYRLVDGSPIGIEGVSVYCEQCGISTHNFADTNSKGEYVFPKGFWTEGRPSFPARILVRKDGYHDPKGVPKITSGNPSGPGWREVIVNGDTTFDMELAPN